MWVKVIRRSSEPSISAPSVLFLVQLIARLEEKERLSVPESKDTYLLIETRRASADYDGSTTTFTTIDNPDAIADHIEKERKSYGSQQWQYSPIVLKVKEVNIDTLRRPDPIDPQTDDHE